MLFSLAFLSSSGVFYRLRVILQDCKRTCGQPASKGFRLLSEVSVTGGKPEENRRKTGGKPEENRRKTGGEPEENRRRTGEEGQLQQKSEENRRKTGEEPEENRRRRRRTGGKPEENRRRQRRTGGKPEENRRRIGGDSQEGQGRVKQSQHKFQK